MGPYTSVRVRNLGAVGPNFRAKRNNEGTKDRKDKNEDVGIYGLYGGGPGSDIDRL